MDMTKVHPLHLHLHRPNNPAGQRGSLSKVGMQKKKKKSKPFPHSHIPTRLVKLEQPLTDHIWLLYCPYVSDWEKDDQYNGSPPRPAPRGPRTPPGPPPPDDDDEEQVPVTGQKCVLHPLSLEFFKFLSIYWISFYQSWHQDKEGKG